MAGLEPGSPVLQASKLSQDQRGRQEVLGTRGPVIVQQFTTSSSTSAVEGKKHKLTADGSKLGLLTEQEQEPTSHRQTSSRKQAGKLVVRDKRLLVDVKQRSEAGWVDTR